jgi:ribosomal protein S3AE
MIIVGENKGNNKITELRTILQRESQNSLVYKQTKSVNNRKTVKTVMTHGCQVSKLNKTCRE